MNLKMAVKLYLNAVIQLIVMSDDKMANIYKQEKKSMINI